MGELLAGLPSWALYGLVGGVLGALFAALGYGLEKMGLKWGRFAVVLAFAFTAPLTDRLVLPALAPAQHCLAAKEAVGRTPVGVKLDELTTFTAMHVNCDAKSIIYDMSVALASTEITDPSAWSVIQEEHNAGQCSHEFWRQYIDRGWAISNDYTLSDGLHRVLTAAC